MNWSQGPENAASQLFDAPFVLVSHGVQTVPILNYGNAAALTLFEMSWEELTATPSRMTAEEGNREEREAMMAKVRAQGFTDGYSGVRVSKTGARFCIEDTVIWNVVDKDGDYCGQAALFPRWTML